MLDLLKKAIAFHQHPILIESKNIDISDLSLETIRFSNDSKEEYKKYFSSESYFSNTKKLIILSGIESNESVQDFLLKYLEEDQTNVYLILTDDVNKLLPSIKSRIRLKLSSESKICDLDTETQEFIEFFKDPNWHVKIILGEFPSLLLNKNRFNSERHNITTHLRRSMNLLPQKDSISKIINIMEKHDYDRIKHYMISESILDCNI